MKPTVKEKLSRSLERIACRYGVISAYLYGSHARGQVRPSSDIDIAVLIKNTGEHSSLDLFKLGREMENETGLKNIDVRLLNYAPLAARGRILTEGRLLYSGDDSTRVDFEVMTRSLYFDFLPHLNYLRQAFMKRTVEKGL
jgi:predicted nucleotidyltransferase